MNLANSDSTTNSTERPAERSEMGQSHNQLTDTEIVERVAQINKLLKAKKPKYAIAPSKRQQLIESRKSAINDITTILCDNAAELIVGKDKCKHDALAEALSSEEINTQTIYQVANCFLHLTGKQIPAQRLESIKSDVSLAISLEEDPERKALMQSVAENIDYDCLRAPSRDDLIEWWLAEYDKLPDLSELTVDVRTKKSDTDEGNTTDQGQAPTPQAEVLAPEDNALTQGQQTLTPAQSSTRFPNVLDGANLPSPDAIILQNASGRAIQIQPGVGEEVIIRQGADGSTHISIGSPPPSRS